MGKGDASLRALQGRRRRKKKKRKVARQEGALGSSRTKPKKPRYEFAPLEKIKEMSLEVRSFLEENSFDEGYYDPVTKEFVARRGKHLIRGGKITPEDWRVWKKK